ncbi:hypothetical protein JQ760_028695 (plasmid) [Klebsiella pneumoniae]|uniref:hypothetical protein n=1 Tax=Klebsiella pneumoniae TaxID=573 RepID=UPI001FAE6B29|nr:hypothetical protein [Klebsiella pneumoniae]MCI8109319.1 hypothetical protein [Klebsiella pneumoniae]
MAIKSKVVDESQMSFLHILEADEVTYVAKYEESYDFRFSSKVAYEMIRDSLYLMTFNRSNLQQRIDEIAWLFSDVNQDDMCSFHNCCRMNGLDPFEIHMNVLHSWKKELDTKRFWLQFPNDRRYNYIKQYIDGELAGYEKYKKAFYLTYPHEAAKRKCS